MWGKAQTICSSLITATFLFVSTSNSLFASPIWNQMLDKFGIDNKKRTQSFCYMTSRGKIRGENVNEKVRIASVSKLYTSLWAMDEMGAEFQYVTRFYYKDGHLHVAGSHDPYFGRKKIFFLLSQLNDLGIKKLKTLSFDKNFDLFTGSAHTSYAYRPTRKQVKAKLKIYFNTSEWETLKRNYRRAVRELSKYRADTPDLLLRKSVSFKTDKVLYTSELPFSERDSEVRKFSLTSPKIVSYLKHMNVVSHNYVAQMVFEQLGKEKKFNRYFEQKFRGLGQKVRMYTGSGLNTQRSGSNKRLDNYSTCSITLKVVRSLKEKMEDYDQSIMDIVAVPGQDGGTFKKHLKDYPNTMVAKTGTLKHTSALAGMLSTTNDGDVFFGIFNHVKSGNVWRARKLQNEYIGPLLDAFGGGNKFEYKAKKFFSVDTPLMEI